LFESHHRFGKLLAGRVLLGLEQGPRFPRDVLLLLERGAGCCGVLAFDGRTMALVLLLGVVALCFVRLGRGRLLVLVVGLRCRAGRLELLLDRVGPLLGSGGGGLKLFVQPGRQSRLLLRAMLGVVDKGSPDMGGVSCFEMRNGGR
jgi:hypothetical protein